jgi:hypothetical protein
VKSDRQTSSWSHVDSHDTLVTSTVVLQVTVVQTLGDIGRLLLDGNQDVAGLVVETMASNQKVPSSIPCAMDFFAGAEKPRLTPARTRCIRSA